MSTQITLMLDPGPWQGPDYVDTWPVGGKITGRVRVVSPDGTKARGVRVEFRWKTEGRGTTD
ncbi:MAG: hypothetical protein JXO22_05730, partial [Phycisphaerae bacterium]|nr:hypothetical protein [Phycisphaerae bacterium]